MPSRFTITAMIHGAIRAAGSGGLNIRLDAEGTRHSAFFFYPLNVRGVGMGCQLFSGTSHSKTTPTPHTLGSAGANAVRPRTHAGLPPQTVRAAAKRD